jgi:hypothetical protein
MSGIQHEYPMDEAQVMLDGMQSKESNDTNESSVQGEQVTNETTGPTPRESDASVVGQQEQKPFEGFEFDYNGKKIQAPWSDPKTKQWAQQGYDYAQKVGQLRQEHEKFQSERNEFENSRSEWEAKWSAYKKLDEWAQQDPKNQEWLSQAYQQYQQKINEGKASQNPEFDSLRSDVNELHEFRKQFEAQQAEAQRNQEDQTLEADVQSVRKMYSHLDWTTPDEHGYNLEQRILNFAPEVGVKSFNQAFKLYYHDDLLKSAEARGREQAAKEFQTNKRKGLLGVSSTPQNTLSQSQNLKSKNYDDLEREALEELGIA